MPTERTPSRASRDRFGLLPLSSMSARRPSMDTSSTVGGVGVGGGECGVGEVAHAASRAQVSAATGKRIEIIAP
ncbi:hypothetical protein D3C81_703350 [compost metagenome]